MNICEDLLKPAILPHGNSQQQERTKEGKIFVAKKQTAYNSEAASDHNIPTLPITKEIL